MADFEIYQPHPSLLEPISAQQRAQATRWLVDAYNDDKLSPEDYERRYADVLNAQNRGQMDAAFEGLLRPSQPVPASAMEPVAKSAVSQPRPVSVPASRPATGGGVGPVLAHASFFLLWIFGPLLTYALARPGSPTRREAAKAFNWQLTSFIGLIGLGIADGVTERIGGNGLVGLVAGIAVFGWFILTILGIVRAGQGDDWTNPVMKVVRWKPMREQ